MSNPEQMSVSPATQSELPMQPADSDGTPETGEELIQRIGRLTRMLRDNMRELGLDREIERAAEAIPDARDRLNYVASTTEKAADRALNACERAQPLQDALASHAQGLSARWDAWYAQPVALDQARELVVDTRSYLSAVPEQAAATNAQLLEIMMAQDFQDLTGQVIKRMMDVIQQIEQQLLQLLIDNSPEAHARTARRVSGSSLLNGPQVKAGGPDVVQGQDEVDDLLDSLGF